MASKVKTGITTSSQRSDLDWERAIKCQVPCLFFLDGSEDRIGELMYYIPEHSLFKLQRKGKKGKR